MVLIAMAGLPGSGKSTIAAGLAEAVRAVLLSVDLVEAAMWRAGVERTGPTGLAAYLVVEAVASEQLGLGHTVVVDAVNDDPRARQQWTDLARRCGVPLHFMEVVCSDTPTHRRRLESRSRDIEGFTEPTWESVQGRRAALATWRQDRLVLDAVRPLDENVATAVRYLRQDTAAP